MSRLLASVALWACAAATAGAQAPPADLTLVQVASGLSRPTAVRHAGDGSGRLFVLEKQGTIRVIRNGTLLPTPFLDIRSELPFGGNVPSQGDERGLLGLAFHTDYESNGFFYVAHTRTNGNQVVARYQVSVGDPDIANPASRLQIVEIPDLATNHNGGDIAFGPDGYLYYSMGDGGPQNDPHGFAQCLWKKPADNTPSNCSPGSGTNYFLLGKIMRLDVNQTTASAGADMCGATLGQAANYAIPPDNPHVGSNNTCDEIWAHGMRNPWRISFDRVTGDLFIGDVGQNQWEEITLVPAGRGGANLGWRCFEGTTVFNSTGPCASSPLPNHILPFQTYQHITGPGGFRCSVTGGYRYRGPIGGLRGTYIYADYCTGEVYFATRASDGTWSPAVGSVSIWQDTPFNVVSFGEDEAGNLYLVNQPSTASGGSVHRFSSVSDQSAVFEHGFEG